jgi:hypothetical protein
VSTTPRSFILLSPMSAPFSTNCATLVSSKN